MFCRFVDPVRAFEYHRHRVVYHTRRPLLSEVSQPNDKRIQRCITYHERLGSLTQSKAPIRWFSLILNLLVVRENVLQVNHTGINPWKNGWILQKRKTEQRPSVRYKSALPMLNFSLCKIQSPKLRVVATVSKTHTFVL